MIRKVIQKGFSEYNLPFTIRFDFPFFACFLLWLTGLRELEEALEGSVVFDFFWLFFLLVTLLELLLELLLLTETSLGRFLLRRSKKLCICDLCMYEHLEFRRKAIFG